MFENRTLVCWVQASKVVVDRISGPDGSGRARCGLLVERAPADAGKGDALDTWNAEMVRALRAALGETLDQFADRLDCDESSVKALENGGFSASLRLGLALSHARYA